MRREIIRPMVLRTPLEYIRDALAKLGREDDLPEWEGLRGVGQRAETLAIEARVEAGHEGGRGAARAEWGVVAGEGEEGRVGRAVRCRRDRRRRRPPPRRDPPRRLLGTVPSAPKILAG